MTYVFRPGGQAADDRLRPQGRLLCGRDRVGGPAYFNKIAPAREALAREPEPARQARDAGGGVREAEQPRGVVGVLHQRRSTTFVKKGDKAGALRSSRTAQILL